LKFYHIFLDIFLPGPVVLTLFPRYSYGMMGLSGKNSRGPGVRRLGLGIALAAVLAGCGDGSDHAPPSLVLVTLDTLRPDYLGLYGQPGPVSPHLDALAEDAWVFERAYATAPFTGPSHASILTSQHPSTHGVILNGHRSPTAVIADRTTTLAEHLQGLGYATCAVVSGGPLDARFGFGRGFDRFNLVHKDRNPDTGGRGERVTAYARDFLLTRAMKKETGPFFLWVHYFDPHLPYLGPPEFRRAVGLDDDTPVTRENAADLPPDLVRGAYRAEVREVDHHVGALLDLLARQGLFTDAVIAVVADHGEYLGEHGLHDHHGLRDEVLHVPLMIRAPGTAGGTRRREVVSTLDLAPTLLDLMGLPQLPGAQGRSLVGTGPEDAVPVFAEWRDFRLLLKRHEAGAGDFQISVQDGGRKLIRDILRPDAGLLFDLARDPAEDVNLFAAEPDLRDRLGDLLDRHVREDLPDGLAGVGDIQLDAESLEMLRSLGYVR